MHASVNPIKVGTQREAYKWGGAQTAFSRMVRIKQGCSTPCILGAKMVQQALRPHSIYTSRKLKQLCKLPGSVQCSLSWNAIFRENCLFWQVGRSRGKAGSTESMSYYFTPSQWLTRRGPLRCTPTVILENDFRTSLMLAPYPPSKTGELKDFIDKRGFIFFVVLTMPLVFIKDGLTSQQLKETPRVLERNCCSSVWLIARISKICSKMPESLEA